MHIERGLFRVLILVSVVYVVLCIAIGGDVYAPQVYRLAGLWAASFGVRWVVQGFRR